MLWFEFSLIISHSFPMEWALHCVDNAHPGAGHYQYCLPGFWGLYGLPTRMGTILSETKAFIRYYLHFGLIPGVHCPVGNGG